MEKRQKKFVRLRALTPESIRRGCDELQARHEEYLAFVDKLDKAQFKGELAIDGGDGLRQALALLIKTLAKLDAEYALTLMPEFSTPVDAPDDSGDVPESRRNTRRPGSGRRRLSSSADAQKTDRTQ